VNSTSGCLSSQTRATPHSTRTPVAPALACWPAQAVGSPEPVSLRPPPGSHRRAMLPAWSPCQPTVSAHPLSPSAAAVAHVDQFRPCPRRISSARGRATTGLPPPLAGDTSGQSTATNRSRVSPIAFPVAYLPPRAPPHHRRAHLRRRGQGRGIEGMVLKSLKFPGT
jgi:hypothetical protein